MAVRKFSNDPSLRANLRKPIGIIKKKADPKSNSSKRKANKDRHMATTRGMK